MPKKMIIVGVCALILAGCATSSYYTSYSSQRYQPKDPLAVMNVYSQAQPISTANPYYVIGKVSIEGFASSGVNPVTLTEEAKRTARKRGADAIINAKTQVFQYYYGDQLLRFTGDLIVYAPSAAK